MYCDVDIYYPGKDLPGVFFTIETLNFNLKKKKKTLKTLTQRHKNRLGKKVWPYHGIFTVLYKCLRMQNVCISSVSAFINAAFRSNIVQVRCCLWLSVAQLKLTHLMHKTIRCKSVLLRMQTGRSGAQRTTEEDP